MKDDDPSIKLVNECRDKLMEHFDSVLILVTSHRGDRESTFSYEVGGGNFYAQLGQVSEWLIIQEQYQRQHAKRKEEE